MTVQTLHVALNERSYPIYIGGDLSLAEYLLPHIAGHQVMIVSNTVVAPLYLARYRDVLNEAGKTVAECILPDGESYKTLESLNLIFDALMSNRFNRDCTILALGGGVVGDMAGFAAASFQRGVHFVQVPTTLLSQVDSSVGGKTGVNHPLGKNMIGAFKQPKAVLADMMLLGSLPDRELSAGLAEVIKYALIGDEDFLVWLETHMTELVARNPAKLAEAVYRSCAHKARIVAADEHEMGERALLNLGHTFGHAIESYMGYGQWLHGEAVAVGMLMAADLSARLGWIKAHDVVRVRNILRDANLPVNVPDIAPDDFLTLMGQDKKVLEGRLRLVLLKRIGEGVITREFDLQLLMQTLGNKTPGVEVI
ncbi:3-dehydroquinate synthase [Aquirhabdus parva]|uniref:3-dehydroquinate synthase n=1 Tax=Aquirhabdus parva TaxID=2283318 RepID=A0A345PB34_9GAMM|nr:3-dehydroquinate synthase [Aquirhabdus parva]AXI04493.1 3-dehydroquinate synthase [Aquirhabdus parva]